MFDLHQDKTHARQTLTIDNQLNQNDKQIDEKYRKIGSSCGVITHKDNSNRKHRFNSVQQNIQMQMQNQQNSHKSWF